LVLDGATDISGIKLEGRTAAWWPVEAYQAELQDCAGHGAAEELYPRFKTHDDATCLYDKVDAL
jgi:hypothetical protein